MVDKIDRPEPVSAYRIEQTGHAAEDEPKPDQGSPEDEFSDPGRDQKWKLLQKQPHPRPPLRPPPSSASRQKPDTRFYHMTHRSGGLHWKGLFMYGLIGLVVIFYLILLMRK